MAGQRILLCYLVLLCKVVATKGSNHGSADDKYIDIVYPVRIDNGRVRRDLSTENKGDHDQETAFRLSAFGKNITVDIKKNREIVSSNFVVRYFNKDGEEIIEKPSIKNCQYQGQVIGHEDSMVVLDTCDGLRGIIEDEMDEFYIEPLKHKGSGAHKISRAKKQKENDKHLKCGVANHKEYSQKHYKEHDHAHSSERTRRSSPIHPNYRKHGHVRTTRYMELKLIVDNVIFLKYGKNITDIERRIFLLVNAVDKVYQKINIRIVLAELEIWNNGDLVPFVKKAGKDLEEFQKYKEKYPSRFKYDGAHLLRGKEWVDYGGMAYITAMCTQRSSGVVGWDYWSNLGPWLALAHEMGHTFGFDHDNAKRCHCLTPRGCIMFTFKTREPGFSDCNLKDLRGIDDRCLYNIPKKVKNNRCGNGVKERGEQCDCGTPENCKIVDPCCNPEKCRLHSFAQCSNRHDKCCKNCGFSRAGTVCRAAKEDCDVPEHCNGTSAQCPIDDYKMDGTNCSYPDFEFIGNTVLGGIKIITLPSAINTRYIRVSPQHWEKDICMRAEIYGCKTASEELLHSSPTALRSINNLCVEAESGLCSPSDESKLILTPGGTCERLNFLFILSSDRILRHKCTGNMVCPKFGNRQGSILVVSSTCTREQAKFERNGKALKHIQSGFCVHPLNGFPMDGIPLVLWKGCTKVNIGLSFIKQDCQIAVGLGNNKIANNKISSSSHRQGKPAKDIRLGGYNSWCAGKKDKNQYIQIDLGKVQRVTAIATESVYSIGKVTGFSLYHSNDGQRWTRYTGRQGAALPANSYCHRGRCAETHNSQCRDLWGPTAFTASDHCYHKLNTVAQGYGTCNPSTNESCGTPHVKCGQIQCLDRTRTTPIVNYGLSYKRFILKKWRTTCSAAVRNTAAGRTLGMVKDGTKCGQNKACRNNRCERIRRTHCPMVYGIVCAGICTSRGKCHCKPDKDPKTNCKTAARSPQGVRCWRWSSWSKCSRICDGGFKSRHIFCYGQNPNQDDMRVETKSCNTKPCPVAHSCRHLQKLGREQRVKYPSDVYTINPNGQGRIKTYCDMTRNGGGWTLLVTSHTNKWTASTVRRRNENSPKLDDDFSILYKADAIKDAMNVNGDSFEYRIEAQEFGRWGGIWSAPRSYTFLATKNTQRKIQLKKKFDKWNYEDYGIEQTMPWVHGATLTTSRDATKLAFGTIAGNVKKFYPAPWINAKEQEQHPMNIWYWVREGEYSMPRSCMEVQLLGLQSTPQRSGVHVIRPGKKEIRAHCDFDSFGGGWTLLLTSSSRSGWTTQNLKSRNTNLPSLQADFSILDAGNKIIRSKHFQYRLEADGRNTWGGIFKSEAGLSFHSNSQSRIELLKKFGDWSTKDNNIAQRLPYTRGSSLTTSPSLADSSGSLVSNDRLDTYLKSGNRNPSAIRLWVREGTWRSCNEINVRRKRRNSALKDGLYMILINPITYLPVYCEMTTNAGAWTLLVTSANNGWKKSQVTSRNRNRPSLTNDYSILGLGDQIKSLSGGKTFQYKLEANVRGRWGGVWRAPIEYSFVSTHNKQTKVNLTQKFDNWQYNWRNSLEQRMPWLGKISGLLTTSTNYAYSEWGTIISSTRKNNPAPWIGFGMVNPGVIWYWINEDDCDASRRPVNGGLTTWSSWSKCSRLCANGKQIRKKTCTSPTPRCGGNTCSNVVRLARNCYYCPESPIRNQGNMCIQPKQGGRGKNCNINDNTELVYKRGCDNQQALFTYDPEEKILRHKCSGKYVCPKGKNMGAKIVVSSSCTAGSAMFERTPQKGLKHLASDLCIHPNGGNANQGANMVLWQGCIARGTKLKLDLYKLHRKVLRVWPISGSSAATTTIAPRTTVKSTTRRQTTTRRKNRVLRVWPISGSSAATTTIAPRTTVKSTTRRQTTTRRKNRDSPIRATGGYCLQPATANCSPPDGTTITYHGTGGNSNVQCSQNYMMFTLEENGGLKHTCSGKFICPEDLDYGAYDGARLVLRTNCKGKDKYTRTSANTLSYQKSTYCIHPESGSPSSGTKAVYWNECDVNLTRIKLDFYQLPPVT